MQKIIPLVLGLILMTGAAQAAMLTVTVSNCDSDQGCVSVALFNQDTRENFGSGSGYYQGKHADIVNGTAKAIFADIP